MMHTEGQGFNRQSWMMWNFASRVKKVQFVGAQQRATKESGDDGAKEPSSIAADPLQPKGSQGATMYITEILFCKSSFSS